MILQNSAVTAARARIQQIGGGFDVVDVGDLAAGIVVIIRCETKPTVYPGWSRAQVQIRGGLTEAEGKLRKSALVILKIGLRVMHQ
jgi:hypothetical protein